MNFVIVGGRHHTVRRSNNINALGVETWKLRSAFWHTLRDTLWSILLVQMDDMIDLRKVPDVCYRKLGRFRADGLAWWAEDGRLPKIEVDIRLKGRAKFETLLHEALHLALPDLSEDQVLKAARFQALVTWAEGYRPDGTSDQEG